jgi:hypothetical protein
MMSDPVTDSTGEVTQYTHPKSDKAHPMNYAVPNFGPDHELEGEKANVAKVEAALGHVFTPTEAGDGHKMNYKVPNFGPDPDMVGTAKSIDSAQNELGPWKPTQDDNGVWIMPGALIQTESDPIVSSVGKIT